MNALRDLIASQDGSLSTMRVAVLLVIAAVLFNWCYLTVKLGSQQPLDWQQVAMIIGALTAKSVQRAFETSKNGAALPAPVAPPAPKP